MRGEGGNFQKDPTEFLSIRNPILDVKEELDVGEDGRTETAQ